MHFQGVLGDFCFVEPQATLLELVTPFGSSLDDVLPPATDDTEVVSTRRSLAVSPCCPSVAKLLPILPAEESLSSTRRARF